MDTVWAVVGIVFGALLAVGLVMLASPRNVRFAQILIFAAAVLLGTWCFAWEIMTDQSIWIRVSVGLVVGIFIFVFVPEAIRRTFWPYESNTPVPGLPQESTILNQNVTSHGQSGGITAHTVNSDGRQK